jgi:hypothetical protein
MNRHPKASKRIISKNQIRRSVATSTAIETGEPSQHIEARLKSGERRFPLLTLAQRGP